jgi:hypothetical protein
MPLFKKKPVVIEAVQFLPNEESKSDIMALAAKSETELEIYKQDDFYGLSIYTLEGRMKASIGDWIIKGVNGELYPCKPDIFMQTYEFANAALKGDE